MRVFTQVEKGSGKVVKTVYVPDSFTLRPKQGKCYIEGDYCGDTYYFVEGVEKLRPPMDVSVEGTRVEGIPNGASTTLNGETLPEGTEMFDAASENDSFEIEVSIKLWPYQDCNFTITPHTENTKIEGIKHGLV